MVGKFEADRVPHFLVISKNVIRGVKPSGKVDVQETEHARVATVSHLVRERHVPPLTDLEFNKLAGQSVESFDFVFMYVGLNDPRYPLALHALRRLDPAKVALVISPALLHQGHGEVIAAIDVAGFMNSRIIQAPAEDENGVETMGKIRMDLLEKGDFQD